MQHQAIDTTEKDDLAEAEKLKILGNKLYQEGDYEGAYQKYTQAIEKDPSNAILYANRAAVHLSTKEYFEAVYDCRKAVALDPSYARAWGRLAKATHAVSAWEESIRSWERAIQCLPGENLTPAQQAMKNEFSQGLTEAKVNSEKPEPRLEAVPISNDSQRFPWEVALAVTLRKLVSGEPTCVSVVNYAYEGFAEAMHILSEQRLVDHPQTGEPGWLAGNPNVLQPLTNSILTDERVFHITDPQLPTRIHRQCVLENETLRGWVNHQGGLAAMQQEILQRLRTEQWEKVRASIATTVRTWVYSAFFRWHVMGHNDFARAMFTQTIKFLEWGRKQWPSVPASMRGVVFEKSWIRGVKRQLLSLMHVSKSQNGLDSPITYDDLMKVAQELIEDVDSDPHNPPGGGYHMGHHYAYWVYPKAQAKGILGWSILQVALRCPDDDPDREAAFQAASTCYLSAAEEYPTDDDYHPSFLRKHLECLCQLNKPLKVTLPLCERILRVIPKALEIWGFGPTGVELRKCGEHVKAFETHWKTEIRKGEQLSMTSGRLTCRLFGEWGRRRTG